MIRWFRPRPQPVERTPEMVRADLLSVERDVRAVITDPGTLEAIDGIMMQVATPQELIVELVDLLEPDEMDAVMEAAETDRRRKRLSR